MDIREVGMVQNAATSVTFGKGKGGGGKLAFKTQGNSADYERVLITQQKLIFGY